MGKSGYLPNVSANFGFFKSLAVNNLQRKDWNGAAAALNSLNGCLGEDYLVTISTKEYDKKMKEDDVYCCNHCTMTIDKISNEGQEDETTKQIEVPTEIPVNEIRVYDLINQIIVGILSGSQTTKFWQCNKCGKENEMSKTRKIVAERVNPFFARVVPNCPIRESGLANRDTFEREFLKWAYSFLEEINYAEFLYRTEWKSQNDGDDMPDTFKDKGDLT